MKMRWIVALGLLLAGAGYGPGSALAQEREWSLDSTDREAFLVFGVPDSDDVGVSFWCAIGTSKGSLYLPLTVPLLKDGQRTDMKVSVDGKVFHLPARAAKEGADGRMTVEGSFRLKDRLAGALRQADSLSVTIKNRTDTYPLTDADFDGFFSACSGSASDASNN